MRTLKVLFCLVIIGTVAGCAGMTRNVQSPGSSEETVSVAPAADLLALPHRYTVKTPDVEESTRERPALRRRHSRVARPMPSFVTRHPRHRR